MLRALLVPVAALEIVVPDRIVARGERRAFEDPARDGSDRGRCR